MGIVVMPTRASCGRCSTSSATRGALCAGACLYPATFSTSTAWWTTGRVLFQAAHQYGRPPVHVYQDGGIFLTRSLDRNEVDGCQDAVCAQSAGAGRGAPGHAPRRLPTPSTSVPTPRPLLLPRDGRPRAGPTSPTRGVATGIQPMKRGVNIEIAHLRGEPCRLPASAQRLLKASSTAWPARYTPTWAPTMGMPGRLAAASSTMPA